MASLWHGSASGPGVDIGAEAAGVGGAAGAAGAAGAGWGYGVGAG
jgi:hypothetical protein